MKNIRNVSHLDKLEDSTAFFPPVTDDEDTMLEDDPAEVVARKTKKCRKRIRAKAPSSSCKKSKTSASAQTPISIRKSPRKLYSSATPKDNQTNPNKSQTDLKEGTSTTSNPQQTASFNDNNNDEQES
ncbi:12109_t:CDS:2 [Dentiscutata erythropus]|uniref:12109_t:CDS:1 n=1 Tax=Dentiscutata erythropus TaxID=1348616 RepID=A0A9N9IEQ2_9GLOM|nr:12109_t:CDS:2 [Dentiscutata erythropus]